MRSPSLYALEGRIVAFVLAVQSRILVAITLVDGDAVLGPVEAERKRSIFSAALKRALPCQCGPIEPLTSPVLPSGPLTSIHVAVASKFGSPCDHGVLSLRTMTPSEMKMLVLPMTDDRRELTPRKAVKVVISDFMSVALFAEDGGKLSGHDSL